jgi:hypothetical protein
MNRSFRPPRIPSKFPESGHLNVTPLLRVRRESERWH